MSRHGAGVVEGFPRWWGIYGPGGVWDVGHRHPWGRGWHRGFVPPKHPRNGHGKGTSQCPLFLGQGVLGAAGCWTSSFVLFPPAALGAGGDPSLPGGVGTRDLCGGAGGQPLRAIVTRGGSLKGGLFCLSLGCWGCWYFGSLNSSDLGGSRPWQALNSYCPFSSPAEWEAGWPRWAGGMHSVPTLPPGDRQMPHAATAALPASCRIRINHHPAPLQPRFVPPMPAAFLPRVSLRRMGTGGLACLGCSCTPFSIAGCLMCACH